MKATIVVLVALIAAGIGLFASVYVLNPTFREAFNSSFSASFTRAYDSSFDASFRSAFLKSCTGGEGEKKASFCECMLDGLAENMDLQAGEQKHMEFLQSADGQAMTEACRIHLQ